MIENRDDWKSFYRERYADQWRGFAKALSEQDYHVRYQSLCLGPLQSVQNGTVLEAGAGRGDLLERFVPESNALYGCDISAGNIEACRERFAGLGRPVHLAHADAERLPYRDNSFDAVYSLSVLFYLPDCLPAVAELFRVAKPGGLVIFDMLNATHVTSLANHYWRRVCGLLGRELGRTSLSTPAALRSVVQPLASEYSLRGNYLVLPAGLPVLKEAGNWCKHVPSLAYAMSEGPGAWLGHKLLVTARKQ